MAKYLVKPNFNRIRQQVAFPAKALNMFLKSEMHDTFGFYQAKYGLYSYMTLNKMMKYVIHTLSGTPLVWQNYKSCNWSPTGSLEVGKKEFEPCKAKINEEWCYDEMFDSCFEHFLNFNGRGPVSLDANGVNVVNELVRTLSQNATLGARLTLTAGQLYDPSVVNFDEKTTKGIQDLFKKTTGACKGWVELVRQMALDPKYGHLNCSGIFSAEDFNGDKYTGSVIDQIFDPLMDKAPADLRSLINEGGMVGSVSGDFMPLFVVSTSIYNALVAEYKKLCISVTCTNPRLTRESCPVQTSRGTRNMFVYHIDDIPVIPISDINCYDKYLSGSTHLAALTASGNINLGASFGALPDIENNDIGIMVERETSVKDLGKYYFLAQSLFAATIADTDYFVGAQVYAEKAK